MTTTFVPDINHPADCVDKSGGWEGLGVEADTKQELLEEVDHQKLVGEWEAWIVGERNGKPAAYLYRPKNAQHGWKDPHVRE